MEMNIFAGKVCATVEKKLGRDYHVEVKKVRKNNGVTRHGMVIHSKSQNVAPTIYLDTFWEAYEDGTSFEEIIRRLLAVCRKEMPGEMVDMEFFHDFEKVKDRICYRLVGRKGNEALLEEVPHVGFLDLALCFYYAYQGDVLGEGSILIHNPHVEMWNTSAAELFTLAQDNTPELFPWVCSSMEEVFREMLGSGGEDAGGQPFAEVPMKVLSNVKRMYGAACMLYPEVLEKLAAQEQNGFYILPSSIHELILLPYDEMISAEPLKRIIHEVNNTQVDPEDVLSDSLYYYSAEKKKVEIM